MYLYLYKQTDQHADTHTQADKQTCMQIHIQTNGQTYKHKCFLDQIQDDR